MADDRRKFPEMQTGEVVVRGGFHTGSTRSLPTARIVTVRQVPQTTHMQAGEQMKRRRLGGSGITVSEICMGTMTFGSQTDEAEAHRILMRGGVFMYPRDTKDASKPGRLRLLYEANPVGMLIEQAGGRASTGREPMLKVRPSGLHQRIGLVFGSKNEVERIERYHAEPQAFKDERNPLLAERSHFRD